MRGRAENERKAMNNIQEMLETSPVYISNYYYTLMDKSYTTKKVYLKYILNFLKFVDKELYLDINDVSCFKNIKPSNINYYILNSGGKNSIKACRFYAIKGFFEYLENDEYIDNNPCNKLSAPKDREEHKITSLTKKEIEIVKHNIQTGCDGKGKVKERQKWQKRDYAIIMLGLSLGLRVTSISEINIEDINFEERELKIVEKGNKERTISFSENISSVLQDWIQDRFAILTFEQKQSDALFISNQYKRISSKTIERLVKRYTYNIDKRVTPHKLRSTCATNVYNKTGDIYLTANILGHSNITNTMRYADVSKKKKEQAAKAMDDILF